MSERISTEVEAGNLALDQARKNLQALQEKLTQELEDKIHYVEESWESILSNAKSSTAEARALATKNLNQAIEARMTIWEDKSGQEMFNAVWQ